MPRLIPSRTPLPAAGCDGGGRTGFGVPAFAHPLVAPAEWAELARPGTPLDWVAFDVSRGPGSRSDPLYTEALTRVRENGVPVLGLLDCAHGTRPFGQLVSDASHYLDWYRVDGFYLDRAPTLRVETSECRRVVSTLRALLEKEHERRHDNGAGGADGADGQPDGVAGPDAAGGPARRVPRIVLSPGVYPYPGYADIADQVVVFNGAWTRYRWSEAPEWSAAYPASRFAHLVHGLSAAHLDEALRIARWQGAGTVCMTDRSALEGADPWAGLPAYWHEVVRKV
ncbi:spherulation-specific family 4 protein [Actinacidiphila acidipaludis]|uniref:Spherulation-specific family 4 protein n=1 Tax=Actinacidiphila acidipaludis TaxID=2873382 RepID=A0ABS7Q5C8_9ACTN|nr:spherulation-specific family 4 protein [Streptomyces acidipaludis]MBY8876974.1 spherulation-specific family 4 protein [Streptomyces acidipaludis]